MTELEKVFNAGKNSFSPFRIVEGAGYKVVEGPDGVMLVLETSGSRDVSKGLYAGPFAVTKVRGSDTAVKVLSYNADENRTWESLIFLGLEKLAVTETEVEVSGAGFVYVELTYADSEYKYEIKSGELPEQSSSKVIAPLADVGFEGGKITKIIQLQYGSIVFPGRVF